MYFSTPVWDIDLFVYLNAAWRSAFLDALMPLVSSGRFLMSLAALLFLAAFIRYGRRGFFVCLLLAAAVGAADLTTNGIKHSLGRVRPLNELPGVHYHQDGEWRVRPDDHMRTKRRGTSYPSAHAANTMTAFLLAAAFFPRRCRHAWLLPLVVGWSRVYLGKHYPSDVMAGWLIGLTTTSLLVLPVASSLRRMGVHVGGPFAVLFQGRGGLAVPQIDPKPHTAGDGHEHNPGGDAPEGIDLDAAAEQGEDEGLGEVAHGRADEKRDDRD